jgi:hypothetical protein
MKVDRNATIAGLPIRKVRNALNWFANVGNFERDTVPYKLGVDVTDDLLAAGLIEPDPDWQPDHGAQRYVVSTTGCRLAATRLLPRINRAKAERIVADLVKRAEAINAFADGFMRVVEIRAFGSYITDADDLGDIDVEVTWERRTPPGGMGWVEWNLKMAGLAGRTRSYIDMLGYGENEARRWLKGRERYLSIMDSGQLKRLGCDSRRIFPVEEGKQ